MVATEDLGQVVGVASACRALALPRASLYRRRRPRATAARARGKPGRALVRAERQQVLEVLHSERFIDQAPAQVWATLLDEETYLCSIRSMYRILADNKEVRERRNQLRHQQYKKPELLATGPNQVWSWDITKLLGPAKWTYFYLYVILDIYSRYVVGWMLSRWERGALAKRLIEESCRKQGVELDQLTIHSDRGPSMTSKTVAHLLADLGVTKSLSRPHVSNDNPYSESQFKTLKYCHEFPQRFGSLEDGVSFCRPFFHHYNYVHRHSGIGLMTPAAVHYGQAQRIREKRQKTLLAAYARHPERFVKKLPAPPTLPQAAWINPPPKKTTTQDDLQPTISTPGNIWIPPVSKKLMDGETNFKRQEIH